MLDIVMGVVKILFQTKAGLCFLAAAATPHAERQLSQELGQLSEKAGDTLKQDFCFNLGKMNLDDFFFSQSPEFIFEKMFLPSSLNRKVEF